MLTSTQLNRTNLCYHIHLYFQDHNYIYNIYFHIKFHISRVYLILYTHIQESFQKHSHYIL
ncbi:hypothetical protein F383_36478 [Gossypium arboreum]|uniref:Uncharacterized protein n=1 Tax=Gossypium arboreum TaxID=29729 RepID=A0A0B0MX62_GOSAR|nr:hypothetical protein F383_33004 [Gossypium arboreum]KHG30270.1 hypothetical protein F383_36478 [Gossypium arboreum]